MTIYNHLNSITAKVGDIVYAGQEIAFSGNSGRDAHGRSYVAHLDFMIRTDGVASPALAGRANGRATDNPIDYLPQ
jgi:murein DD-endopeptidase MepM/ murein hydrolase activator NlpD